MTTTHLPCPNPPGYSRARATLLGRVAMLLAAVLSAGCAAISAPYTSPPTRTAPTSTVGSTVEHPATSDSQRTSQVYVYPSQGQSEQQLDRDRYECYRWAVAQTGFDPSQQALAPHQRVEVIPSPPPGTGTVAGALTGAVLGAAVSHRGHAAEGAAVGAVMGGLIGSASDAARIEQAREAQRRYDQREAARLEQQSSDYRRALTACLEGRGYTVK